MNQRHSHSNCDEDELKLTLANGTVIEDRTLINTWFANSTMYGNITMDSQVFLPCETLNMASILGISLGIGIPVLLVFLCCMIPLCCGERKENIRHIEREKLVLHQEEKKVHVDTGSQAKSEVYKVNVIQTEPPIIKPPPMRFRSAHADEFLQDSSYIRHVARILDYDYEIPSQTFEWIAYNQPQLYDDVRVSRKEGMPEKRLAIKVMQTLVNTHFVTMKEKEKLQKLYPNDFACIMSLDAMATI